MSETPQEPLVLFDDLAPEELPLSPGELNQLDTRRQEWKKRQRRSRATRRLAARVENALADGVGEQMAALQAQQRQHDERLCELVEANSPLLDEWVQAQYRLWGAIFLGGHLASRVFDGTDGQHLPQPFPLIFKAARSLHARGLRVDTRAIDRELKTSGVILMPHFLAMLDDVFSCCYLPARFTVDDVDEAIQFSKEA